MLMIKVPNVFLPLWVFFLGLILCFAPQQANATHIRAGDITATRVNCSSRTFKICITLYVNTDPAETDVEPFSGGLIDFGDGTNFLTEGIKPIPFGDPKDFVGVITFCIDQHTYPALGQYRITYNEHNRNAGILNVNNSNSVNLSFFLETIIVIDPFIGCDNSPRLLVPPIDKSCGGVAWFHNPGAYDIDGDSLSYKLIMPRFVPGEDLDGKVEPVPLYSNPNDPVHYAGLNYNNAQEDGTGQPTFKIDPITGTISWDSPGKPGEYNIAFLVIEWRKVNDVWLEIGSITRDMQVIVEDCLNNRPILEVPKDLCVVAGELVEADIFGIDPDFDPVLIEVFSETLILAISRADYNPKNIFQPTTPNKAKITFKWKTECAHIKQQPYQVVFKITDKPKAGGVKLTSFATWNITVVGPQPVWETATIAANRAIQLDWKKYDCTIKADSMQVWRRIDSVEYKLDTCLTGMPQGLGYTKIKTVKIAQTDYLDTNLGKGLPPGSVVCYRLVAQFPAPLGNTEGGSESLVSEEICYGPLLADAPVMTNVTIDTTNRNRGRITVRWTPPFDLDPFLFPPPYTYDIHRAIGFSGNASLIKLNTARLTDTVFVNRLINTSDNVYNYRVLVYDKTETVIDTSAIASTVRLQAKSLLGKIEIAWTAEVPWSLKSMVNPKHVIYRGEENDTEGKFVKIDSVTSSQGILRYTDKAVIANKTYCYRVETRGGYGNEKIREPLINFSQIVCARSSDIIPPCQPELTLEVLDCEEYFNLYGCSYNGFSNVLRWPRPTDKACREDISHYKIYYSTKADGVDSIDYKLLVDLKDKPFPFDTMYVDQDMPSFARCYKLVTVDRSGNESERSAEACNDNCPNYQLPNVFTPDNGDGCNDFFSAYSDRSIINGILQCGNVTASDQVKKSLREQCPRFVLKVEIVIADRWGKQVYSYASGGENSIFIDWNGHDSNGKELAAGVYFYYAKVLFETLRLEDSEKIIKGWVQIVRTP